MDTFTEFSKLCNLKMPMGFPSELYDIIHKLAMDKWVVGRDLGMYTDSFLSSQLTSSWMSVAYKFRFSFESSQAYVKSTEPFKNAMTAISDTEVTYAQECALFNFFMSSLYYFLHFIGALIDPGMFKYDAINDKVQRNIIQKNTQKLYSQYCQTNRSSETDALMDSLIKLDTSKQYDELKVVRNQLAHRVMPIRVNWVVAGSVAPGVLTTGSKWLIDIPLDIKTTTTRFEWLTQVLNEQVVAIEGFVRSQF